jgi:hypothetical protein
MVSNDAIGALAERDEPRKNRSSYEIETIEDAKIPPVIFTEAQERHLVRKLDLWYEFPRW